MIWVKGRDYSSEWIVYHKDSTEYLYEDSARTQLNLNSAGKAESSNAWHSTVPTEQYFTQGHVGDANWNGSDYISYLFASVPDVSKVGSYKGNGTTQTINAEFTQGAKYVLIKRTDSTGDWYVWDSVRGIVSGNDPHLSLNTTAAEVTGNDSLDPDNSGFIVNQNSTTNINVNGGEYIYLAIANDNGKVR